MCRNIGAPKIVWCNLRQEPYVYINGSPYCLKDRHNPFKNMLNTGILAADVEHAEVFPPTHNEQRA